MPNILSLVFLLTDPELLADIFHWGLNCGLLLAVALCAGAARSMVKSGTQPPTAPPAPSFTARSVG